MSLLPTPRHMIFAHFAISEGIIISILLSIAIAQSILYTIGQNKQSDLSL